MGEVNLPKGWATTKLELLTTDISYGYTAPSCSDEVGPKMLRITDIQDNSVVWSDVPYCEIEEEKLEKYLLKKNDLVFARTGATVGKSFLIRTDPPKAVYASYLIRVRTTSEELISILSYFFNSQQYWQQITEFSSGIGQPNVNGTKLKGLTIPLPPLAEQKIIVDKLDTLLAQVETTKSRLERIHEILKHFRQSVLTAAMSGILTDEWRDSNGYSLKNWSIKKIDDISSDISYGYTASSSDLPIGPKMLRITDIQDNKVNWDDVPYCKIEEEKKKQYLLACGDLVFARTGATVGKSFLVRQVPPESVYASYLIRVRCNPTNSIEYLALFFQSNDYWNQITEVSTGIAQPSVNGTKLKNILVSIPPLKEQSEIVRRVEELLVFADIIEQKTNTALERVSNLTQSILAKAFRGELTNDWRATNPDLISGENSAEALLKKIKIEREILKEKPRARTVRKKKESVTIMANKLIRVLEESSDWIAAQEAFRLCGVTDGTPTERIEELYSELRGLDKAGRLQIDTVTDEQGRKLYDCLKLTGV